MSMDPRMIPAGASQEHNFGEMEGKVMPNNPGVYYHPQAGKFIETANVKRQDGSAAYHQETGKIQGDAFKQIGFRPASKEELEEYQARQKEAAEAARVAEKRTTTVMSSGKS